MSKEKHLSLVITKQGTPIAKLVPIDEETKINLFGVLKGTVNIKGNIVEPIDELWDAESCTSVNSINSR